MACGCCRSRNILMFILVLQMVSHNGRLAFYPRFDRLVPLPRKYSTFIYWRILNTTRRRGNLQVHILKTWMSIWKYFLSIASLAKCVFNLLHTAAFGRRTPSFRFSWFHVGADYREFPSDCLVSRRNIWSASVQAGMCHSSKYIMALYYHSITHTRKELVRG